MSAAGIVQVTVTCDSAETLDAMVHGAVSARLAACGQVEGPLTSTYRWGGEVQTSTEWRATFKTTAARAGTLEEFLVEQHPYDLPEVLRTPVLGGEALYLDWVREAVGD
ncbi:divalent-cation tolerance protein CutA [Xylanimonas oleitrophica]|uniref:Divalent-cation tolerance protein CutA n=1 Tax=Xylanimonas oleitrophica TaxID=2607479 RepID=A0A2W5YJH6_9MICO|nr:divalent-cation tolerance protein CutA [Xylanimonas oleitrophica]PZR55331.1 divalent-cation tolerance protein CutA [Xylanimonas oleitrophica]